MRQYLMGTRNVKKQNCDLCCKLFEYRKLRICSTTDGDILVCSKCYSEIMKNDRNMLCENITTKNFEYDVTNEVTDEEKVRDAGL